VVQQLALGWMVQGSNTGEGEIFYIRADWPWGPPQIVYSGYCAIPGGKVDGM